MRSPPDVILPPENISAADSIAPPRPVAELARRPWDARMVRFLKAKRRQGRPIRWIAERLGLDLLRVVAMAVNLRLTLRTAYRGRSCKTPPVAEPPPLGPENEIAADGLCRWIAADPSGPWAMCARPAAKGTAYCPHHKQRAYVQRKLRLRSNVSAQPLIRLAAFGVDPPSPARAGEGLAAYEDSTPAPLPLAGEVGSPRERRGG